MLVEVPRYFQTVWTDFTIKNQTVYDTEIDILNISYSDSVRDVALNFHRYNAYNLKGYGENSFSRGITEQEAYDAWLGVFNQENKKTFQNIAANGVTRITQNVYDGLVLLNWATGNVLKVEAAEGLYDLSKPLLDKDYDTMASMINRSAKNKQKCNTAASVLRLVEYGKYKTRTWLRTQGIYEMRTKNELGSLNSEQLRAARFAYYAETLDFLPFTPEGIKRDIAKKYEETITRQVFTYDGTTSTFELNKVPSMEPVEKLSVRVNGNIIQHFYDFTVSGRNLIISKTLNNNDIVETEIKI